jgi:hypothetical protein
VAGRQDRKEVVLPCADGPFCTVSAMVLGGNVLKLDGRLRGAEEIGEFDRGLIVHLDKCDGMRVRREESTGRAKGMHIGGRSARLEGNEMDVVAMQEDKNVFKTVVRWDGKTTGKVGRSPFIAGVGVGASSAGRKGRSRGSKARASARRRRHSNDGTQTRLRDFAARRSDTLA